MEPSEETDLEALKDFIKAIGILDPSFRLEQFIDTEKIADCFIRRASPRQSQETACPTPR